MSVLGLLLALATGFFPTGMRASLSWHAQTVEIEAAAKDKVAVGSFPFVNTGDVPVTFTSIQSSCDCTVASLAKQSYAPQESGEIKVTLTIGDRLGLQESSVKLTTQDSDVAIKLVLRVRIPEQLTISPKLLLWRASEDWQEKSVIVAIAGSQNIADIEVLPATPQIAASRIETIEPGVKYRIFVKPSSRLLEANRSVAFVARFADSTSQQFRLYLVAK